MIIKFFGIDRYLALDEGQLGLINIHNHSLYKKSVSFMNYELDNFENNEIVFLEEDKRLDGKKIEYLQDVFLYTFNTKNILDALIKMLKNTINEDVFFKETIDKQYLSLIMPLLNEANLLEIEYDYKQNLDTSFYSKIPNLSFKENDELQPLDKIINIMKTNIKLFNKNIFVMNGIMRILNVDDLKCLSDFCRKVGAKLLLLDYIEDSEVVIRNNLCIDEEYGTYTVGNGII